MSNANDVSRCRRLASLLTLCALIVLATASRPCAGEVPVTGWIRGGGLATWVKEGREHAGFHGMGFARARFSAEPTVGAADFGVALELAGAVMDVPGFPAVSRLASSAEMRDDDLSWRIIDDDRGRLAGAVDRLFVSVRQGAFRAVLGRQPVGFGTTRFFPVMDFITPLAAQELDRDTKPGVDALRGEASLGSLSEAGFLILPAQRGRGAMVIGHGRTNVRGVDLLALGGSVGERAMLSLAAEGEVFGAGLRCEAAWWGAGDDAGDESVGVLVAGMDGRLPVGVTVAAEYFARRGGVEDGAAVPEDLLLAGLVPLAGRDYLALAITRSLHPLVNAEASVLVNLHDGSFMTWPSLNVSLADDWSAVAAVYLPWGDDGDEFGGLPTAVTAYLTWYF